MVVTAGVTDILVPVPISVVPQPTVYHLQTALVPNVPPVIPRFTDMPGQILFLFLVAEIAATERVKPVNLIPGEMYWHKALPILP